jgi:hypothetical protein
VAIAQGLVLKSIVQPEVMLYRASTRFVCEQARAFALLAAKVRVSDGGAVVYVYVIDNRHSYLR